MERQRDKKTGRFLSTHGHRHDKIYKIWEAMKRRCSSTKDKRYNRYGGRGITVCEEWAHNFQAFYDWSMQNGYLEGLTIDRIDVDGNYEPSNCRWVTKKEQNRNYSRNHYITYNGTTKCVKDWAEHFEINYATILWRIKTGKSLDEVFEKCDRRKK